MSVSRREVVDLDVMVGDVTVRKAKVNLLKIPLTTPFRISLGTVYDYEGTIVELISEDHSGFGEGSTIQEITGEVPAGVFETSVQILRHLKGRRYDGIEAFLEDVYRSVYSNPTAKNAIDMALHDLVGKTYGIHVTELLGGGLTQRETSLTIGLGSVEDSLRSLRELKKMNVRIVKVKVGGNADLDVMRIKAVSEHLDGRKFYADANQGFKLRDALKVAKVLADEGALFFEQPMERHNLNEIGLLRRQSGIPIMLDESIGEPFDVIESILSESADLVNVKLTKSGGIRRAFKTLVTAQSYGIDAMVGCMVESKLAIAASLSVASSLSNVIYTDLDGFHSIASQPFDGGVEYKSGVNTPVRGVGFASSPSRKRW